MKGGGKYNSEVAEAILIEVASTTTGIIQICKNNGSSHTSFFGWLKEIDGLAERYARAKSDQMHLFAEEILDIADNTSKDVEVTAEGIRVNHDVIQRDKLRVDTRKWLMSKLAPKTYGERQTIEHEVNQSNLPDYFKSQS